MRKVESIHINGLVFVVEDDAYEHLAGYLDALSRHFAREEGGNEIMADIEARMAELLTVREGSAGQVVTYDDVADAIAVLGTVEDITGEATATADTEAASDAPQPGRSSQQVYRSPDRNFLYRDPDHRIIGGVCAGMAGRMRIDPLILRLLFVLIAVLSLGVVMIPIYIVLWIAIPLAKTTAQKLKMQGKPVNIQTISQNVRQQASISTARRSLNAFFQELSSALWPVFKILGRVTMMFVGTGLFISGICIAIGASFLWFWHDVPYSQYCDLNRFLITMRQSLLFTPAMLPRVCTLAFIILTMLACIFWGIWMLTCFKIKHFWLHIVLLILWILTVATIIGNWFAYLTSLPPGTEVFF